MICDFWTEANRCRNNVPTLSPLPCDSGVRTPEMAVMLDYKGLPNPHGAIM